MLIVGNSPEDVNIVADMSLVGIVDTHHVSMPSTVSTTPLSPWTNVSQAYPILDTYLAILIFRSQQYSP